MFVGADGKVEERVLTVGRSRRQQLAGRRRRRGRRSRHRRGHAEGARRRRPSRPVEVTIDDDHRRGAQGVAAARRRRRVRRRRRPEQGDVAVLHRPPDLRLGDRHRHHARRACWRCTRCRSSQYPQIAPTTVRISATYPGADAQTVENSVTKVIEQGMTGIDNLDYMTSTSTSTGPVPDHADLHQRAPIPTSRRCRCRTSCSSSPRCCRRSCRTPASRVTKSSDGFLMVVALRLDRRQA